MKISYRWLREYLSFERSPEEIGEALTQTGLEVESIERVEKIQGGLEGIVLGEILSCEPHPRADRLKVTKVDIGMERPYSIVCGAPNAASGQKVVVATINSTLYPTNGASFKIKKTKIRGEVSEGMICAEDEIGLGIRHDGIMTLDTTLPNGTPAAQIFEIEEDYVLEINLTPNRGDAISHWGVARDLKAWFKKELNIPKGKSFSVRITRPITVKVEDHKKCPRFSGITLRGLHVTSSPDWLQTRLQAIGLDPINNIVDITNYVMHSIGQPMHAYDATKVKGNKIIVKTLEEHTPFITLDGKQRKLSSQDLMVCNGDGEGMCMAGVFGGIESAVTEHTTDIFLESAHWSPESIRATTRTHAISTDASFRYERGTDPNMTTFAVKLATSWILDIAGGYAASDIVDIYPHKIENKEIPVTFQYFHWIIGKKIPDTQIIDILQWLDIRTKNITSEGFMAVVPSYRREVTRPIDLVEEVLRIYGFNEVELDSSSSSDYMAAFNEFEPYRVQENISRFLAGKGFSEILTNSLTHSAYFDKFPVGGEPIYTLGSSNEDLALLKTTPIYTALEAIAYNINRKNPNLKMFELSKSYQKEGGEYKELAWLSFYLTGHRLNENWLDTPVKTTFHDLSSVVFTMLAYAGIRSVAISAEGQHALYEYGAIIRQHDHKLGVIGRLKNEMVQFFGIKQEVFHCQLDWDRFLAYYRTDVAYHPVSKYPEVKRDLSLVIDKSATYAEIEKIAFRQEKKYLNRLNLLNIYEGEKIEKEKKAYAISFYLQDKFKTLTNKQIDKCMRGLINAYQRELGAIIRK